MSVQVAFAWHGFFAHSPEANNQKVISYNLISQRLKGAFWLSEYFQFYLVKVILHGRFTTTIFSATHPGSTFNVCYTGRLLAQCVRVIRWQETCYTGRFLAQQIARETLGKCKVTRFHFVNISGGHVVCFGGIEKGSGKDVYAQNFREVCYTKKAEFVIWWCKFLNLQRKHCIENRPALLCYTAILSTTLLR